MPRENMSTDPSCSADDGVTKLQEDVLGLLEDAGVPQEVSDQIMTLIADAEQRGLEGRGSWDGDR